MKNIYARNSAMNFYNKENINAIFITNVTKLCCLIDEIFVIDLNFRSYNMKENKSQISVKFECYHQCTGKNIINVF